MEWETPEFAEIPLACEVSSYTNAELESARAQNPSVTMRTDK